MVDPTLSPSVRRVTETLAALGAQGTVRTLTGSARTAREAAEALGVDVGQIASSLLFRTVPPVIDPRHGRHELEGTGEPLLVLASGAHRVDTLKVAGLDQATPEDVRAATGFAIGGVAPVGHPQPLRTLVDVALARYEVVWAAAGHPYVVFSTTYDELVRITGGHPAEVA